MPEIQNLYGTGAGSSVGTNAQIKPQADDMETKKIKAMKLFDQGYSVEQVAKMLGMEKKPKLVEAVPYAEPTFKDPFQHIAPSLRNIGKPREEWESVDPLGA